MTAEALTLWWYGAAAEEEKGSTAAVAPADKENKGKSFKGVFVNDG
jgi:hypothetical protein